MKHWWLFSLALIRFCVFDQWFDLICESRSGCSGATRAFERVNNHSLTLTATARSVWTECLFPESSLGALWWPGNPSTLKWSEAAGHSFFLHTPETWQPLSIFWKQPRTSAKSVNVRKAFTLGSCCKTTTAQFSTTQHCWKDKLDFLLTSRVVGSLPQRCHYAQLLPGLTGPTVWKIGRCQTGKRGANMFLHRRASTVLTATDRICVWIDPKSRCSTRPERVCNLSNVWFCRKTKKYFFTFH